MVRNYVRKTSRCAYAKEQLMEAVMHVKNGTYTIVAAAKLYNIPRSTLIDHVNGRRGFKSQNYGKPTALPTSMEKKLARILRYMKKNGFNFMKKTLVELIGEYCRFISNMTCFKNGNPGEDWLLSFSKRNGLSTKAQLELKSKEKVVIVKEYFEVFNSIVAKHGLGDKPEQIWNIDEVSFHVSSEGAQGSFRTNNSSSKRCATILTACNAVGQKAPLLIVVQEGITDLEPDEGVRYANTKKGWLEKDVFRHYFTKSFLTCLKSAPPILITYNAQIDNVDLELMEETRNSKIFFLKVPPQIPTVMDRLKIKCDENLARAQTNWGALPVKEFAGIVAKVYNELSTEDILHGFKKSGIYPSDDTVCDAEFGVEALKRWIRYKNFKQDENDESDDDVDENIDAAETQQSSPSTSAVKTERESPSSDASMLEEELSNPEFIGINEPGPSSTSAEPREFEVPVLMPAPRVSKDVIASILKKVLQKELPETNPVAPEGESENIVKPSAVTMPGCALRYCRHTSKNATKSAGITFHRFVRSDSKYYETWLQFVRNDRSEQTWKPAEHTYLCSAHFRELDFIHTNTGRKFLKKTAIPFFPSYNAFQSNFQDHGKRGAKKKSLQSMPESSGTWNAANLILSEKKTFMAQNLQGGNKRPNYGGLLEAAKTIMAPCTVCCVFGCRNNENEQFDKSFYAIPDDPDRYTVWLKVINREDLIDKMRAGKCDSSVCSDHFDEKDYNIHGILTKEAVPHLKLPQKTVDVEYGGPTMTVDEIKVEPVDEPMQLEIQFDPEVPPTVTVNPTPQSASYRLLEVTPMQIDKPIPVTVSATPMITSAPAFAAKPPLSFIKVEPNDVSGSNERKMAFFKRATISPIETINIPPVEAPVAIRTSTGVQTTKKLSEQLLVPLKKEYEVKLREANKKIKNLEKRKIVDKKWFIESCDRFLDPKIANVVKAHATLVDKFVGNRYSTDFKMFALNLYLYSPQSYKFVEEFFYLPSMKTIQRFRMPVKTGFNPSLMEPLKTKVAEMSAEEKVCTVCFDCMELNKNLNYDVTNDFLCGLEDINQTVGSAPAEYAPLIMAKSLYSRWKQPVSFALISEKKCQPALTEWIYKTISTLVDIGLNVKAFVTNLDTELCDFSDISVSEPYFEVNGRKIYHIFDVRLLYKSARDDLMEYDFHIGSKIVKWDHILEVYEADKRQELSLMPLITEKHVRPNEEEKEDLKTALQLFSRSVAAAMNFHVKTESVDGNVRDTVEFITLMNCLFEMLNSLSMTSENMYKRAYKATPEQIEFLVNVIEYLQILEIKDKNGDLVPKKLTFVTGLLVTIKSLVALFDELKQENLSYILTRRLGKGCMDEHFSKVRDLSGNCCTKPTPVMFARAFRRLFLTNILSNTKNGVAEMADLKSTLAKISIYVSDLLKKDDFEPSEEQKAMRGLNVGLSDYQSLYPAPPIPYIAGYLFWKCLEKHTCGELVRNLCTYYDVEADSYAESIVGRFKEYNAKNMARKDLIETPNYVVAYVDKLFQKYKDFFLRIDADIYSIGWNIYLTMEDVEFHGQPCDCFPVSFMKFLFIRMKISHTTKDYNKINKPNRKPVKPKRM